MAHEPNSSTGTYDAPLIRSEIKASTVPLAVLAERYNVSKATARKWKSREDVQDRSHRPHTLSTTLSAGQEALVVELRRHAAATAG